MRIEQLTFPRFIIAILIVIFHFGHNAFPFNISSISFIFNSACYGVGYFFILSGFIMMVAYQDKKYIPLKEFYQNRIARIYPLYLFALIVFVSYLLYYHSKIDMIDLILNALLLQSWIPGKALTLNFPGWFIPVELFFYLIFPFLFNYIYSRYTLKKLSTAIVFFWISSQILIYAGTFYWFAKPIIYNHDLMSYFPLVHLNQFLIGNLAGMLFIRWKPISRNYDILILLNIILILIAFKFPLKLNYHDGMMAILYIPLIFLICLNTGFITKFSCCKIPILLGEMSYAIYILQLPVFNICFKVYERIPTLQFSLFFMLYLVVLIFISYIAYYLIEIPARKWLKNL